MRARMLPVWGSCCARRSGAMSPSPWPSCWRRRPPPIPATASDPGDRYATVIDFVTAWEAALVAAGVAAEPAMFTPTRNPYKGLAAFDLLNEQAAWPVRLAFFKPTEASPLPEVEMGFNLYANGVIAGLRLDYQDFSVRGKLQDLVKIELPDC